MTPQTLHPNSILIKLKSLPLEQQQQVLDFVEFLAKKYVQSNEVNSELSPKKQRIAGLHEGMGWMAEDFNAPLPDDFWMGEE